MMRAQRAFFLYACIAIYFRSAAMRQQSVPLFCCFAAFAKDFFYTYADAASLAPYEDYAEMPHAASAAAQAADMPRYADDRCGAFRFIDLITRDAAFDFAYRYADGRALMQRARVLMLYALPYIAFSCRASLRNAADYVTFRYAMPLFYLRDAASADFAVCLLFLRLRYVCACFSARAACLILFFFFPLARCAIAMLMLMRAHKMRQRFFSARSRSRRARARRSAQMREQQKNDALCHAAADTAVWRRQPLPSTQRYRTV